MGGWGPVVVSAIVNIVGIAIMFGTHHRAIKDHDNALTAAKAELGEHGKRLGKAEVSIGRLKLVTGINGDE